ncbi:hypothetical protein cypCar_00045259 [Cyprinus carpio]|nr:hypothetical protein cypCar_00045259 [Cyprinus carpio]
MIRTLDLFFLLCLVGVFDVESHGVSVMVGDSVTLDSNASEIELKNEIEWRFNGILIANVIMGNLTYHDYTRFKDRLKLDRNGSLTIKDTRITDAGVYELSITSNREHIKRFSVTVYDEVLYGGGTEPVIRLVVTALVGLAAVAAFIVLLYDIRSRRDEQERHR